MRTLFNSISSPALGVALLLLSGNGVRAQTNFTNAVATMSIAENNTILREFQKRNEALRKISNANPTDWEAYESAVRAKMRDFPQLLSREISGNAYEDLRMLIWHFARRDQVKCRALANEIVGSSAPARLRSWAAGYLKRLDSTGQPVTVRFTAMDGREVDSTKMIGQVVLIDFWE